MFIDDQHNVGAFLAQPFQETNGGQRRRDKDGGLHSAGQIDGFALNMLAE